MVKFDQGKRRNFGISFGTKRKNSIKIGNSLARTISIPFGLVHTMGTFVPLDRVQGVAIQVVETTKAYIRPVLNFSRHNYLCNQQSIP